MKLKLLTFILLLTTGLSQAKDFTISGFGAVADTTVLSTKAIQAAIDKCHASGGGKVIIPAGNYKTGTIYLKNNVSLHLEKGATLFGSPRLKDYPENAPDYIFLRKESLKRALIYAFECTNIALEGEGTIDGQGAKFWVLDGAKVDSYAVRPYLIWMIRCTDVRTEGLHLRNSGLWMQHYLACDNVYIHNINVFNHSNKNNDLMDIDGCHDVRISDIIGDSDDDGITMKSTSGRGNENIAITNCIISSHCNALKMGTESSSGFKNIAISNIVIRPSKVTDHSIEGTPRGHTGIALEEVDGGTLDGVVISNIRMEGPVCPIFIRLGKRNRPYTDDQKFDKPNVLRNVSICNVIATGAQKNGCSITGVPGQNVENVSLSNIRIEFEGGGTSENYVRTVPEKEKSYPEFDMFDDLPAYGFYVRHARNIRFSDIQMVTKNEDMRPAFYLDDVNDSQFDGLKVSSSPGNDCVICAENSKGIRISNSENTGSAECFVNLKGSGNSEIILNNNIISNVNKLFAPESVSGVVKEFGNMR